MEWEGTDERETCPSPMEIVANGTKKANESVKLFVEVEIQKIQK